MSEPTCQELCCRDADCLSGVGTYLPGTVLQGCRLFKRCLNLAAGHCVAGVQAVQVVSEPTLPVLLGSGAVCFSSVRTYLPGTVLQGCRLFKQCRTYLPVTVLQVCRLFKQCGNLPFQHCWAGEQSVSVVSELTCQALWDRGAGCLSSVETYLPVTVLQGYRLYKQRGNLPDGQGAAWAQAA